MAEFSASGLPLRAAPVVMDTTAFVLGGVSEGSLPESESATPRGAGALSTPAMKRQWISRLPSARRSVTLPANSQMAKFLTQATIGASL